MFTTVWILEGIKRLIPLILSLTVHEWAHAYSAFRLGDDTASRQGRLTLNPIPHIDPWGTLVCPFLGIPFGWAKPVPVNPLRFRRDVTMRTGMMITAAAGPLSNVALAVLCAVGYGLLLRFGALSSASALSTAIEDLMIAAIKINLGLFLFNFIPVPPLDGSRIVDGVLPYRFREQWDQLQQYSPILLLAVIYFGRSILGVPIHWLFVHFLRLTQLVAGL